MQTVKKTNKSKDNMVSKNSLPVLCIYAALFRRSPTGVNLHHQQSLIRISHRPKLAVLPWQQLFLMMIGCWGNLKAYEDCNVIKQ